MDKIEINLDDLEMTSISKKIISKETYVPVMIVGGVAIVDEQYFLMGNIEQSLKKAIYDYAIAINKYLKV
jgi:hypothetical protein